MEAQRDVSYSGFLVARTLAEHGRMLSTYNNGLNTASVLHLLQQSCRTVFVMQLIEPDLHRLGTRHGIVL